MKKISSITIAIILVFTLFSTTGYAKAVTKKITAVFGSYVVKLNGKAQKTQTLSTGSTVYIPINEVTTLTGATVKKSSNTYNITPVIKEDGITKTDISKLKYYSEMTDLYYNLEILSDTFFSLSYSFEVAYNEINLYGESDYLNTTVLDKLNQNINIYNNEIKSVENSLNQGKNLGLYSQNDFNDLNQILNTISDSIDSYKLVYTDLNNYSTSKSSYDQGKYHANGTVAYEKASKAEELAHNGYMNYFKKIQNY